MHTMEELKAAMEEAGVGTYFDALSPWARSAIHMEPQMIEDADIPVGVSKLGGCPDLPEGTQWPCSEKTGIPMSFIAQIRFEEAAPFDAASELPAEGLLSFFYDCSEDGMVWGFDPEDCRGWRVLVHEAGTALARCELPSALTEEGLHFGSARLTFEQRMELPSWESDLLDERAVADRDDEAYWEWVDEQSSGTVSKLLGHSDNIQSGMELECEIVTHGFSSGNPAGFEAAKKAKVGAGKHRWRLLMQIDSHEELGMMWGDLGRLYLWIPREALAAQDFSKCWMILQCG